jgi:hypothetical protein
MFIVSGIRLTEWYQGSHPDEKQQIAVLILTMQFVTLAEILLVGLVPMLHTRDYLRSVKAFLEKW